jgi:hypothetical protein
MVHCTFIGKQKIPTADEIKKEATTRRSSSLSLSLSLLSHSFFFLPLSVSSLR